MDENKNTSGESQEFSKNQESQDNTAGQNEIENSVSYVLQFADKETKAQKSEMICSSHDSQENVSHSDVSDSFLPMDCSQPGSSAHGTFPGDLLNPGVKPGSPALHVDSSPPEPPGKPTEGK